MKHTIQVLIFEKRSVHVLPQQIKYLIFSLYFKMVALENIKF